MDHYGKARREGLREYAAAVQAHQDPYLPVLEDREPDLARLNRRSLGIQNVPLEQISGSVSQGRSYAFARNFFPLLESGSEFAGKWNRLYASVEEEGLNQPVTLLEYMGSYYVAEGNKRVSVMKCMNALDIEASVTRVIPPRTDDPENISYFEYCDFARETGLYNIFMTRPGSYEKLLSLPGVRAGSAWTEEEIFALRKAFSAFRVAYTSLGEGKRTVSTGDAFLSYLVAFDFRQIQQDDSRKTAERVRLMSRDLESRDKVQLVMEPDALSRSAPSVPLLSSLFRPARIRMAFLYTRSPEDSAWEYWHEIGRLELEKKLGDRVETAVRVISSRDQFRAAVDPLIRDGYTAFFATTPVMMNSCIEPALEYPNVHFFCCSPLSGSSNVRTYYIRFYEAKFLLGLAAGILSRNGKIGYIADFPIFGVPSAVNAFTLGARMANPEARIYLNWSSAVYFDPSRPFEDPEIRMISNRDITSPTLGSREVGLHISENGSISNIAMLIPRWGSFYQMMAEQQLAGAAPPPAARSGSTGYWWGLNSGMLDLSFSRRMDRYALRLVNELRSAMQDGRFSPFEGELRDQAGTLRCEPGQQLTPAEILCMDYLLDHVTGDLPGLNILAEYARPLVKLQGIHGELKPELSSFSWA